MRKGSRNRSAACRPASSEEAQGWVDGSPGGRDSDGGRGERSAKRLIRQAWCRWLVRVFLRGTFVAGADVGIRMSSVESLTSDGKRDALFGVCDFCLSSLEGDGGLFSVTQGAKVQGPDL